MKHFVARTQVKPVRFGTMAARPWIDSVLVDDGAAAGPEPRAAPPPRPVALPELRVLVDGADDGSSLAPTLRLAPAGRVARGQTERVLQDRVARIMVQQALARALEAGRLTRAEVQRVVHAIPELNPVTGFPVDRPLPAAQLRAAHRALALQPYRNTGSGSSFGLVERDGVILRLRGGPSRNILAQLEPLEHAAYARALPFAVPTLSEEELEHWHRPSLRHSAQHFLRPRLTIPVHTHTA
jgi:hypothetical protein